MPPPQSNPSSPAAANSSNPSEKTPPKPPPPSPIPPETESAFTNTGAGRPPAALNRRNPHSETRNSESNPNDECPNGRKNPKSLSRRAGNQGPKSQPNPKA